MRGEGGKGDVIIFSKILMWRLNNMRCGSFLKSITISIITSHQQQCAWHGMCIIYSTDLSQHIQMLT